MNRYYYASTDLHNVWARFVGPLYRNPANRAKRMSLAFPQHKLYEAPAALNR